MEGEEFEIAQWNEKGVLKNLIQKTAKNNVPI
jgi:hypothetical protein